MSDYFTDAARWEHFAENLAPWQRETMDAVDSFRFQRLGQRVTRAEVLEYVANAGIKVEDKKWIEKLMQYLCALGFADPVFEGWVFGKEY